MLNYKSLSQSVKDVDTTGRVVTGYFASFDDVDSDGDFIERGAFAKTIQERGPKGSNRIFHFYMHSIFDVIGKPRHLEEDEKGLYFETPFPKTQLANDVLEMYKEQIINEHSIGFEIIKSRNEDRDGDKAQGLEELRLWEGSTVIWGANANTPTAGVKSLDIYEENELEDQIHRVHKFLKDGKASDDTFLCLEYHLKQLQKARSLKGAEPPSTPEPEPVIELFDAFSQKLQLNNEIQWNLKSR